NVCWVRQQRQRRDHPPLSQLNCPLAVQNCCVPSVIRQVPDEGEGRVYIDLENALKTFLPMS
ncbi:MAG: hypothetical protein AAF773_19460, partial [Cyanobacteria bacterium P01_D01_bin.115]